jgi:hypothetical protein
MEYFFIGLLAGMVGYFSIQLIYNWVDSLADRARKLRFEIEHYRLTQEQWSEFQVWKQEKQKENK